MAKIFHVEIVSPQRLVYSGEAQMVDLPGTLGPFQVLVNHAPIVSQLETGILRVQEAEGKERTFATSGGFVEMNRNRMTVVVEAIEESTEIDPARAEQARDRALERVRRARQEMDRQIDVARADAALARATNRLRLVGRL